jgi:hypothetical protein
VVDPALGAPPLPPPGNGDDVVGEPAAAAPQVAIRPLGDDAAGDDHAHTVTVARAVIPPEDTTATNARTHSTRRVVLGTVAGVVCLLLVAAFLVFGGGDDDEPSADTEPATTQLLSLGPPTPQGVTVARAAEPGTVVVAWQAVDVPGIRYQVLPQTGGQQPQNTDQLSITFAGVGEGERPCFTVLAISTDGQTSDESPLACLN